MRPDKEFAIKHGVPTRLRRDSARYGRGVGAVVREYAKYPNAGQLDHGRDRAMKKLAVPLPARVVIEGLAHAA